MKMHSGLKIYQFRPRPRPLPLPLPLPLSTVHRLSLLARLERLLCSAFGRFCPAPRDTCPRPLPPLPPLEPIMASLSRNA